MEALDDFCWLTPYDLEWPTILVSYSLCYQRCSRVFEPKIAPTELDALVLKLHEQTNKQTAGLINV